MKVRIIDESHWYFGKIAEVVHTVWFGDMAVYQMQYPSGTGNATIGFALRAEKVEVIEDAG